MSSTPPPGATEQRRRALAAALFSATAAAVYLARLGVTYPVRQWLFWRYATCWAWGLFLIAACASAGHLLLVRALRITGLPRLETIVHSTVLGLLIFVLGMYAGGAAHVFHPVFAVAWPMAMLLAGGRTIYGFLRERADQASSAHGASPAGGALAGLVPSAICLFGVVGLGFVYLGMMAPQAINFDASWSHLKSATDYARHGGFVPFDADYTRNVPELASLVHTFAMIVPEGPLGEPQLRWMLAQHLELAFFLVTLGGIAAMARWLLDDDRARGTWAAFFLFPAIFVYDSNLGCGADHYLAVFAPSLFLAAMRATERFEVRYFVLAGAFAAGALLTKYQAVYLLAGVVTIALGRSLHLAWTRQRAAAGPPPWRPLLVGASAFAGTVVILTAPHFVKNWAFHHNPIYPFAQDLFASRPTVPNGAYLAEWIGLKDRAWVPEGPWLARVVDSLRLALTFSFEPHYSFTRSVPVVGSLFTLCTPLLFFVRRPRRLWLGYGAGLVCLFAWAMIYRVDRHLQTFLPLLVASTAAVIARAWALGPVVRAGLVPLIALQVVWGGDALVYDAHTRIAAAFDSRAQRPRGAGGRARGAPGPRGRARPLAPEGRARAAPHLSTQPRHRPRRAPRRRRRPGTVLLRRCTWPRRALAEVAGRGRDPSRLGPRAPGRSEPGRGRALHRLRDPLRAAPHPLRSRGAGHAARRASADGRDPSACSRSARPAIRTGSIRSRR